VISYNENGEWGVRLPFCLYYDVKIRACLIRTLVLKDSPEGIHAV
jgi:hypothetical protein